MNSRRLLPPVANGSVPLTTKPKSPSMFNRPTTAPQAPNTGLSATVEDGFLVIRIPVNDPLALSQTGKSWIVATTHGAAKTQLPGGEEIGVNLTAFMKVKKD